MQFPAQDPKADLTKSASFRFGRDVSRDPIHFIAGDTQAKLPINRRGQEQISAPPIVHEVLRSPGQPLDSRTRVLMESRFGYDFSGVRVHSDAAAERSARDINANAYTVRQNIVFGTGQFAPHQRDGRKLLAHELAHVVQQGRPNDLAASQGNNEQDAKDVSDSVGNGNALVVRTNAVFGTLQRQAVTGLTVRNANQNKSRLVRIERYWHSPSARAFFEDGSNEEVTFVDTSSFDQASQPEEAYEKVVDLAIDRSSPIRPHVEFAPHASGSKVKVVTRRSPADRISKLPANVRGELSQAFLSDPENEPDPQTMEFIADMGDRLTETSGTTKIEIQGGDPATLARMHEVDQWVSEQQSHLDKLGAMHRGRFTQLLSDVRQVKVTGPIEQEDLDVQDIELVLAGAAGGQSEFQTFAEFKRVMDWRLHSGNIALPEEMANNPEFFIRNEYRKAWKAEAAGLRKMSRIAYAAQIGPLLGVGASAIVALSAIGLEAIGAGATTYAAAKGISSSLLGRYIGTSLFAFFATRQVRSLEEEATAAGMDPNSPSVIAKIVYVALMRTLGPGEVAENITDRSMFTQQDLERTPFERVLGGVLGTASAIGNFHMFVPEVPKVAPAAAPRPTGSRIQATVLNLRLRLAQIGQGESLNLGLNSPTISLVDSAVADSTAGNAESALGDATVRPDPATSPDLPNKAPSADPLAGQVPRPVDVTGSSAFPPTADTQFNAGPGAVSSATDASSDVAQLRRSIKQAEQRYERLRLKARQAEDDYANSVRNQARAMERRGDLPTQREQDLLATKASLQAAREDALSKLKQLKRELDAVEPKQSNQQHGQAGLAQEPIYVDELRARGLPAEQTDKNMPVIDAAVVGTPELHSVKSLVPSAGTEAAVRLAESGSPRGLADRVSAKITEALIDRRSDKWGGLRKQWNNTKRATYADRFGYEVPKNPDDMRFVVDVRVITGNVPSSQTQEAVEAAVTRWLSKNERVPPGFTWRIVYVSVSGQ